eukprot:9311299-Alexandrium_andersonii.AAC.1
MWLDSPAHFRYRSAKHDAVQKVVRPVPMNPDRFGEVLRTGVRTGDLAFTAKADLEVLTLGSPACFCPVRPLADVLCTELCCVRVTSA